VQNRLASVSLFVALEVAAESRFVYIPFPAAIRHSLLVALIAASSPFPSAACLLRRNSKMNLPSTDIPWKESRFHNANAEEQEKDDENDEMFEMFADPDPHEVFEFEFSSSLQIQLDGQKQENGQLLHSTGLTLWRASELLCKYLLDHTELVREKRVLEVRSSIYIGCFFLKKSNP
jgi:hypothetical protein